MGQRTRLTLALIFVALLGWFAVDLFDFAIPPTQESGQPESSGIDEERAHLKGAPERANVPAEKLGDETDLRALVTSLTQERDHPAAKRIAALAADDPAYVQQLIGWLRPERDGERAAPMRDPLGPPKAGMTLLNVRRALVAVGRPALDALVAALNDTDEEMRIRVAQSIGFFGAAGAPAVPELVARCGVNDLGKYECAALVNGLGGIGPPASDALPQLHTLVRGGEADEVVEHAAIDALLRIAESDGETLATVKTLFEGDSYTGKLHLLQTLSMDKGRGKALIPLIVAVVRKDEDERLSKQGVRALASIGAAHPDAVALLLEVFHDAERFDWQYRSDAAYALGRMGDDGRNALMASLDGRAAPARVHAVGILRELSTEASALRPLLMPAFETEDVKTLRNAYVLLSRLEPTLDDAAVLQRGFTHADQGVRSDALSVIDEIEGISPALIDALLALQDDPKPSVKSLALHWLQQRAASDERVRDAVLAAVRSPDWQMRVVGFRGVRRVLGDDAAGETDLWLRGLRDGHDRVFYIVLYEVGEMGRAAKDLLPELRKLRRGAADPKANALRHTIDKIVKE